jgi:thymidylate synthase (FAD)
MDQNRNNQVELIGFYGGDETHALSAWTSTSRDLNDEKRARMGNLLNMLARENHGTPYEKSAIHFLVTTDIASHIHLAKHRTGVSLNGESARYKELKDDKFYVPVDWDDDERARYTEHLNLSLKNYHETLQRLVDKGVPRKRAKESARLYLPYGIQLTADVMFNFRSFVHFIKLRYSNHAQLEIREISHKMLQCVADTGKFDLSLRAHGLVLDDGSVCPPFA